MPDGDTKSRTLSVALVGNPNVGKSVIFNLLTGVYVDVSNYPGTTIEVAKAKLINAEKNREFEIIDTPGVYGVSSTNDEERATLEYVIKADLIVNVVSALSLSRDLFLTKQLCDLGKPMILVINQSDEALKRKIEIDTETLKQELNIPVIKTIATSGEGVTQISEALYLSADEPENKLALRPGKLCPEIEKQISKELEESLTRSEALLKIEAEHDQLRRENFYQIRRQEVNRLVDLVLKKTSFSKRDFLGKLLLHPLFGSIAAVGVLYLFLYLFLGIFVAGTIVGFIEEGFFQKYYEPFLSSIVSSFAPVLSGDLLSGNLLFEQPLAALGTFLAGDYGVLTLTITYLYGLLFPLVFGFYFGLALLEDSGYLPRLAVLVDGLLSRLGMNGRAIVPLILGGGCVTMATVTTRLLKNDKEKVITMALLGLTIPCSAQLGVIQGLLSNIGGVTPWLIWALTLAIVFGLTGIVMNKMLPGECGDFVSDIPPLRVPVIKNIWSKTFSRTKIFLDEATPAFFIAAALVAALQVTGSLETIINWFKPLMSQILLLPEEVALSFILGMVRRDFGAFGLMNIEMTAAQLVTACVVLTLFVPCIATVAVMIKEKNFQTALGIWLSSWILAFGLGGLLSRLLNLVLV